MMEEMVSLISNVGFPIACCAAMFWQNNQLSKQHAEESAKWATTLEGNTTALLRLENTLSRLERDVAENDNN